MKDGNINQLLEDTSHKYKELIKLQEEIKRNPHKLKTIKLEHIETPDEFHSKKLNSDYDKLKLYKHKHKSTVDVLNKVKDFLKQFSDQIIVDFELDKEHHTTVAIAGYEGPGDTSKVYLWKGTYEKPDYIKFKITPMGECRITRIFSQEQGLGHKSFMFNVLKKTLQEHNTSVINNKYASMINEQPVLMKIVADLSENTAQEIEMYNRFFVKKGFEFKDNYVYKLMSKL